MDFEIGQLQNIYDKTHSKTKPTFPNDLIPFDKTKNTTIHTNKLHNVRVHFTSFISSIPLVICRTLLL